jgi:hypothetical protein
MTPFKKSQAQTKIPSLRRGRHQRTPPIKDDTDTAMEVSDEELAHMPKKRRRANSAASPPSSSSEISQENQHIDDESSDDTYSRVQDRQFYRRGRAPNQVLSAKFEPFHNRRCRMCRTSTTPARYATAGHCQTGQRPVNNFKLSDSTIRPDQSSRKTSPDILILAGWTVQRRRAWSSSSSPGSMQRLIHSHGRESRWISPKLLPTQLTLAKAFSHYTT